MLKREKQLAEVAHLVEHDLAKVGVAGSSPVFCSKLSQLREFFVFKVASFSRPVIEKEKVLVTS